MSLFQKASELTLNTSYKKLFIECSKGIFPKEIKSENGIYYYQDESVRPENEKELCAVFLKWFKKISSSQQSSVSFDTSYPSICSLKDVPSKVRGILIEDYTIEMRNKLHLSEERRENLHSVIWFGIYCGYINLSDILIQNYKIVEIPFVVQSEKGFIITSNSSLNVDMSSIQRSSQKK